MRRVTILALLAVTLLFANAGTAAAQTPDTDIFGLEMGQTIGYSFAEEEIAPAGFMGLHFGMTESMELGFVFTDFDGENEDTQFGFVRMTYFLHDLFGFQLSTGSGDNEVAGGLGVFSTPIRREFDDTLTTSLRLGLDYLVPNLETDVADGILSVTISGKIAF